MQRAWAPERVKVGMRRVRRILWAALSLGLLLSGVAAARDFGFIIDTTVGRIFPTQLGYVFVQQIQNIGLDGPQDLFLDQKENLYIVDTGNSRILKVSLDGKVLQEIGNQPGEGKLAKPEGVYVTPDGRLYVADTGNKRIVQFNPDGSLIRVLAAPESILLGDDFHYQPTKVVEDQRGYLYVVNSNDYRGMITLDANGNFRGFFAPNRMPFSLRRVIINLFATKAQKEKLSKDLPTPHSNAFMDDTGYIYTSTVYERQNQLKKLNTVGNDVLNPAGSPKVYGFSFVSGRGYVQPNFIDVAVDQYGTISTVDSATGYVYQYDQDRNLLLMYGGKGEEKGRFGFPSSIVQDQGGRLYILDKDRNDIQVFRETQFAQLIHQASALFHDGRYADAAKPWREVLTLNTNYGLAHSGIAKNFMKLEQWDKALAEYRFAENRDGFSTAFSELRHDYVREHFGTAILFILLGLVAVYAAGKGMVWVMRRPWEKCGPVLRVMQNMFRCMFDPHQTFWELRHEGKGSIAAAIILIVIAFCVRTFNILTTSFQVANVDPRDVSLLLEAMRIFAPWLLWGVANYGVSAIMEGEGRFRDILIGMSYSLGPYIVFSWPLTLLTHVMSRAERNYYYSAIGLLYWWILMLIFTHLRACHNYTGRRAIVNGGVTVFGMACIVFCLGLTYALTDQLVNFVRQIMIELTIRG